MRGKKLLIALLCIGLLSGIPVHQVCAKSKTIKVGYIDYAGFIEKKTDGSYSGYGVEYLNRVAEYTKWNYEFEKDTWDNCLSKLKDGKIDLLCTAQYTEDRAKYMDYSVTPIGKESTIIYTSLDNTDIYYNDYSSMNGKTVALLESSYQTDSFDQFAKSHGFTYVPKLYDSVTEMMSDVKQGKVDLAAAGSLDLHTDLKVVSKFNVQPFYFTTTKGKREVIDELNIALNEIKDSSPYYEEELYEKYYGESAATSSPLFTRAEAAYIKNSSPIVIGLPDNAAPITCYDDKVNGMAGITEDILQLIAEKSGLEFQYKPIAGYQIDELKSDKCDLLGCILRTQQMASDANMKVSAEYMNSTFALAGIAGRQFKKDTEIRIAVNQSLTYAEKYIKSNYPNARIQYYDSNEKCADAVLNGKEDIILQNVYILSNLLRKPQYEGLEMAPTLSMDEPIALMGDEDTDPVLMSVIDKTIAVLDEESINQIIINHTIMEQTSLGFYDVIYKHRVLVACLMLMFLCIVGFIIMFVRQRYENVKKLEEKNLQLREAIDAAQRANEAKSLFLSRMSHEIRTPMNAIIGINSLIKKHIEEPKRVESYVNKIALSSTMLLNLINDILDMSAIDQQKMKIAMLPFDMEKIVESIVSMYTPIFRNKAIDFRVEYDENIQRIVVGDQLRVNQIILNLLSNAVKFTQTKGIVNLRVKKLSVIENKEYIRIEVQDNGIGISQEQMGRLFQPFEQEDGNTARIFGGSGLGLAITKSFVELMNGTINVESEKGKGTLFIVELPFDMAKETTLQEKEEIKEGEEVQIDLTGHRILLADDNSLNLEIAVELLENVGAIVDTVENGKDAVDKFIDSREGTYELILMDVQMPIMDGYEATAQIRHSKHPQASTIPILAMTANAFTEDVTSALAAGMNTHIAKPIDTDILYKTIEVYLNANNNFSG